MRRKEKMIRKAALLKAVENTYPNSQLMICHADSDDVDFSKGIGPHRPDFISREKLLKHIVENAGDEMRTMPEYPRYIVISPKSYISGYCIDHNQQYFTDAPEGYERICDKSNNYDIYIYINRAGMTITFLLGRKAKVLTIIHSSEFVFKVSGSYFYCSLDAFERTMRDPFWAGHVVTMGRKVLGIKPAYLNG